MEAGMPTRLALAMSLPMVRVGTMMAMVPGIPVTSMMLVMLTMMLLLFLLLLLLLLWQLLKRLLRRHLLLVLWLLALKVHIRFCRGCWRCAHSCSGRGNGAHRRSGGCHGRQGKDQHFRHRVACIELQEVGDGLRRQGAEVFVVVQVLQVEGRGEFLPVVLLCHTPESLSGRLGHASAAKVAVEGELDCQSHGGSSGGHGAN
mmetsp:Transcript_91093/g.256714  ORF Transcript_91093/g.256714 Transcript_91093/m.256714 type:complete len:202 (-) Transcript_91093:12-617(-)